MQHTAKRTLTLLLAAGMLAPNAVSAAAPASGPRSRAEAERPPAEKAPLPPGEPTTPANVHLPTEGEIKLGREAAAEVEKENKILTEGPYHDRLQRVAAEVSRAILDPRILDEYRKIYKVPRPNDKAKRLPFEFTFKVVDDAKDVNAFALPGGFVYVTRGLLDEASTDHELAGVLAHECVHVVFHHTFHRLKKAQRLQPAQIGGLLVAILAGVAGSGEGAVGALQVTQGLMVASLTGYTQELEREADRYAVRALHQTGYNPVGMLTFMQKLDVAERLRGHPDWGIYRTHPYTNQRLASIEQELKQLGYRVDDGTQRVVSGRFRLKVAEATRQNRKVAEITLNDEMFFTVGAKAGAATVLERGEQIVRELQGLLGVGALSLNDIRRSPDHGEILVRGVPVIRIYPDDAALGGGLEAASDRAYRGLARVLLQEQLDRRLR